MIIEHAPQVARGHTQSSAYRRLVGVIQHATDDQLDCPAYERGGVISNRAGRSVGRAAQARPVTCGLCSGRQLERPDVRTVARATSRSTIGRSVTY